MFAKTTNDTHFTVGKSNHKKNVAFHLDVYLPVATLDYGLSLKKSVCYMYNIGSILSNSMRNQTTADSLEQKKCTHRRKNVE